MPCFLILKRHLKFWVGDEGQVLGDSGVAYWRTRKNDPPLDTACHSASGDEPGGRERKRRLRVVERVGFGKSQRVLHHC